MPKIKGLCNKNGEEWLPVVGYEEYFQVSNLGRIKIFGRDLGNRKTKTRITEGRPDGDGYLVFKTTLLKKLIEYRIHRLVGIAFIPNPDNLPQINHKDGDKKNNKMNNLEWCNNSHNTQHAWDTGLRPKMRSIDVKSRKLGTRQVRKIRELYATGLWTMPQLGKRYKVDRNTISSIVNYKTWKDS